MPPLFFADAGITDECCVEDDAFEGLRRCVLLLRAAVLLEYARPEDALEFLRGIKCQIIPFGYGRKFCNKIGLKKTRKSYANNAGKKMLQVAY